ncbi:hypothetical protein EIM50_19045, partial [Pseudoxanthomonas sp. SGD-10]
MKRGVKRILINANLKSIISKCVLLFFVAISQSAFSGGILNLSHYSSADGLSDNRITTIIKDREGFVWLASWAGINRFDGKKFIAFKSNPGDSSDLKSNRIDEIVEDKTSSFLWVRAYDNQVYRFDKRKHTFTPLTKLISNTNFSKHQFAKILSVSYGKVWLKTSKNSVIVVDDAGGNHPSFNELNTLNDSSQKLYFFYLDKQMNAWISNERGLFLVKQDQECNYKIAQRFAPHQNP